MKGRRKEKEAMGESRKGDKLGRRDSLRMGKQIAGLGDSRPQSAGSVPAGLRTAGPSDCGPKSAVWGSAGMRACGPTDCGTARLRE